MTNRNTPDGARRWLHFAATVVLFLVGSKLAAWVLFGEPLLARPVPAVVGSLLFGYLIALRQPARVEPGLHPGPEA